ncbi:MAG: hypothetical protein ABIL07_07690 [candidate division WOR-3 bacterium]
MVIVFIISMHFGIEGGINQPIIGFDYTLNNGTIVKAYIGKQDLNHNVHLNLTLTGSYYQGKNTGYSFSKYGLGIMIRKIPWRIAPFGEMGIDYVSRELNKNKEWGVGFSYTIGFLVNFYYENINVYPAFYYDGVTDFKIHAGNLGIKLGIKYEL